MDDVRATTGCPHFFAKNPPFQHFPLDNRKIRDMIFRGNSPKLHTLSRVVEGTAR
jgi:hypothetical protein